MKQLDFTTGMTLDFWHYCINCSCYKYLAFYQMG